jgi:hypothetical protein
MDRRVGSIYNEAVSTTAVIGIEYYEKTFTFSELKKIAEEAVVADFKIQMKTAKEPVAVLAEIQIGMLGTLPFEPTDSFSAIDQWYSTIFVRVPPDIIYLQLCTP